jgi:hypothetical protein
MSEHEQSRSTTAAEYPVRSGALGSVLLIMERWPDAQASFSAAVLLDGDNPEFRRLLKEARSHR